MVSDWLSQQVLVVVVPHIYIYAGHHQHQHTSPAGGAFETTSPAEVGPLVPRLLHPTRHSNPGKHRGNKSRRWGHVPASLDEVAATFTNACSKPRLTATPNIAAARVDLGIRFGRPLRHLGTRGILRVPYGKAQGGRQATKPNGCKNRQAWKADKTDRHGRQLKTRQAYNESKN
jgi:hypothetical protein